jgi:hypothetical protein
MGASSAGGAELIGAIVVLQSDLGGKGKVAGIKGGEGTLGAFTTELLSNALECFSQFVGGKGSVLGHKVGDANSDRNIKLVTRCSADAAVEMLR